MRSGAEMCGGARATRDNEAFWNAYQCLCRFRKVEVQRPADLLILKAQYGYPAPHTDGYKARCLPSQARLQLCWRQKRRIALQIPHACGQALPHR